MRPTGSGSRSNPRSQCGAVALDRNGWRRTCVKGQDHEDDHVDAKGFQWQPPRQALAWLKARWKATHWVRCTDNVWIATAHREDAPWRTEIQHTPTQLDDWLQRRGYTPTTSEERR